MALTAVDIYKRLPQTNCARCGSPSCFVFATKVALRQEVIEKCVVLSEAELKDLKVVIGEVRTVMTEAGANAYAQAAEEIKGRIRDIDFRRQANGLGAQYLKEDDKEYLSLILLNHKYKVSKDGDVIKDDGGSPTAWAKIFLIIYINMRGEGGIKNEWVSFGGLPKTFAKQKSFKDNSEDVLVKNFSGKKTQLKTACNSLGGMDVSSEFKSDMAYRFFVLPKIPFLLLFWDEIPEEGFPARVKILMDRSVLAFIDIESLVFLAERFARELVKQGFGDS
ncbi:MAG: DUF3786 domain-containing protein [Nitrospirae bacterium]|nr:DUF3786 domain-containing protein [Nitrospirota bacterium]